MLIHKANFIINGFWDKDGYIIQETQASITNNQEHIETVRVKKDIGERTFLRGRMHSNPKLLQRGEERLKPAHQRWVLILSHSEINGERAEEGFENKGEERGGGCRGLESQ